MQLSRTMLSATIFRTMTIEFFFAAQDPCVLSSSPTGVLLVKCYSATGGSTATASKGIQYPSQHRSKSQTCCSDRATCASYGPAQLQLGAISCGVGVVLDTVTSLSDTDGRCQCRHSAVVSFLFFADAQFRHNVQFRHDMQFLPEVQFLPQRAVSPTRIALPPGAASPPRVVSQQQYELSYSAMPISPLVSVKGQLREHILFSNKIRAGG